MEKLTLIAGLIAMFSWGIGSILEKKATQFAGPIKPVFYVSLFNLLLGLPLIIFDYTFPTLDLKFFMILFALSFIDFLGVMLFFRAYTVAKVSLLTPITSSYAVLTAIISVFFFNEYLSFAKIGIIFYIVCGIILLSLNVSKVRSTKGELMSILYGIMIFCIYGTWVPLWDNFITTGSIFFMLSINRILISIFSAIFLKSQRESFRLTKLQFIKIFVCSATLFVGNSFYNWGLSESAQTSLLSAVSSAYPLVTVIIAYLFLKEKLKKNQYLGIFVIISGIVAIAII